MISKVAHSPTKQPVVNAIFDVTNPASIMFQASRAPVTNAHEIEHSGRHTQKERRDMCSGTLAPGGEVHGFYVGCMLGMLGIPPFVCIQLAGPYRDFFVNKKMIFEVGVLGMR